MNKTLAIALTSIALAGTAVPAFANPLGDGGSDQRDFRAWSIQQTLEQRGINATSVDAVNGYVRAFVTQPDGTVVMKFFEPTTLKQVNV